MFRALLFSLPAAVLVVALRWEPTVRAWAMNPRTPARVARRLVVAVPMLAGVAFVVTGVPGTWAAQGILAAAPLLGGVA